MTCRACGGTTMRNVIDLGLQPLPNQLRVDVDQPQVFYPLRVVECGYCGLMQTTGDILPQLIFDEDYPYFSSANKTDYWQKYAEWIMHNHKPKRVLEIASNDGYLLQHFPNEVDVLGYEPCQSVALAAIEKGVETVNDFFDEDHPYDGGFDVIIGNNVLAHTPDPVGMLMAAKKALNPKGVILFEFPHAYQMFEKLEWDTIYHEHYSYLTVRALKNMAKLADLQLVYTQKTSIHGGSLRCTLKHEGVETNIAFERYDIEHFRTRVWHHKRRITDVVYSSPRIAGFGAAAKAATMIHYCGVADAIDYIVDETPHKQGKYLSGTNIPIVGMDRLRNDPPEVLWIFPWNFADSIIERLKPEFSGTFMTTKNGDVQCPA